MEFALSEDQLMVRDSLSGVLASASALDEVRKVADGDGGARARISDAVGALGLGSMLVPETLGGLGLGLLDAVVVQEQLGGAVAPVPFLGRSVMVPAAIARAGTADERAEWFGRIANGEVRFAVALMEQIGAREDAGLVADDGRLTGKVLFAMDVEDASHVLVADRTGRLHICAMNAADVVERILTTIDRTRRFSELTFNGTPTTVLTGETEAGAGADAAISAGRLMIAADTLGAGQAMLDKAVAYAMERKQFGRTIGSFQAVKHLCAEMVADLEPCRSLVWHAAHAVDEEMEEAAVMVCLAKAHLAEVGTFVARTATEVHGGMGFTDLLGLHYWFKRIGANRQLLGGSEQVREHAARLQGWA